MWAPISASVKKVSPQNGGFIRANELSSRIFFGKAKPVIFLIDKDLSSSQRNVLGNFLLLETYWTILLEQNI